MHTNPAGNERPGSVPSSPRHAQAIEPASASSVQRMPALLHHLSPDGFVMQVSDRWLRSFAYERVEVIGRHIGDLMTAESANYVHEKLKHIALGPDCDDLPLDFVTAHGEVRAMNVSVSGQWTDDDALAGIFLVGQPAQNEAGPLPDRSLTEAQNRPPAAPEPDAAREALLYSERQLRIAVFDNMSDALIRTDARGRIESLNAAAERLLGTSTANALRRPIQDLLPIIDPTSGEVMDVLAHRERPWVSNCVPIQLEDRDVTADLRTVRLHDAQSTLTGHLVLLCDLSETRKLRDTICFQAEHDALTGLFNRHEFSRRLKRLIEQIHDDQERHALCYIDIDQFRLINDTCGHAAGDELLRQFGELLSHGIRGDDTLARIGNDQYTLLLRGCSAFHAQRRTRALLDRLDAFRFQWEAKRFRITVSIGLVPIDVRTQGAEGALRAAESACQSARAAGRNRFVVFDAQDDRYCRHFGDLKWMRRVESALEENRFTLHAQPIRALGPDAPADNYELLVRMVDRAGKDVAPGQFLPAVERFNLSAALDRWVVREALTAISRIEAESPAPRFWTINLSGQSLSDRLFQDFLLAQLNKNDVAAGKVCFEITETAAIAQMDRAIDFMNALRERGCALALDDFGSGLSSFAYLKNLPVDIVKIDGQFVRDIAHSEVAEAMVQSINQIAQLMGKRTVAEYVENNAILDRLRAVGVDFVQGYGIGMPRPITEIF